jgi:uncharacterized protein
MQDGPIDLIVEAYGDEGEIRAAYYAAELRFVSVLDELCSELAFLRQPARLDSARPDGPVARRMVAAVRPYAPSVFITPMAAVAGAVAEEILKAITSAASLTRAYVNNGGDIALHLIEHQRVVLGLAILSDTTSNGTTCLISDTASAAMFGMTTIDWSQPIRGIATSGWRGRSFSLGIADAVTVLADTAAMADAAATVIANAIDLPGHPAVERVPACELAPDSDLGERLVTRSVGELKASETCNALGAGVAVAQSLYNSRLIRAAALHLQRETRVVGSGGDLGLRDIRRHEETLVHA